MLNNTMENFDYVSYAKVTAPSVLNELFAANNYEGADSNPDVMMIPGDAGTKLLISSPHAVNHHRYSDIKVADDLTGAISLAASARTRAAGIIMSKFATSKFSEFGAVDTPYAVAIHENGPSEYKMLLDVHGMMDKYGPDICFGTGPDQPESFQWAMDLFNILFPEMKASFNTPFSAMAPYTVTTWAANAGMHALQIELSDNFRARLVSGELMPRFLEWVNQMEAVVSAEDWVKPVPVNRRKTDYTAHWGKRSSVSYAKSRFRRPSEILRSPLGSELETFDEFDDEEYAMALEDEAMPEWVNTMLQVNPNWLEEEPGMIDVIADEQARVLEEAYNRSYQSTPSFDSWVEEDVYNSLHEAEMFDAEGFYIHPEDYKNPVMNQTQGQLPF